MPVTTYAEEYFPEEGSRIIQVSFTNEDGEAIAPKESTITWTLTDRPERGGATANVINNRSKIPVASASTINIVLSSDDLAIQPGEENVVLPARVLLVEYQYDSAYANNIDDKAQFVFNIENIYSPTF